MDFQERNLYRIQCRPVENLLRNSPETSVAIEFLSCSIVDFDLYIYCEHRSLPEIDAP